MPRIFVPLESAVGETRVAATPETIKKFVAVGSEVFVEKGAGASAGFSDESYKRVGGQLVLQNDQDLLKKVDIVLCVNTPNTKFLEKLNPGTLLIGLLNPYSNKPLVKALEALSLSAIALELLPRISRAQSSDALSSQANIAGYKAVLLAASALDRYFPMLMTAAGTVQPAKVVVLGAGVAGLQAIATAKRLGAVVFVSDIRPAVQEQVESLGARFIALPEIKEKPSESGGYASQASEEFLTEQRNILKEQLAESDVAICTAQIPGKRAPLLINDEMLDAMRPGAVIVDLAASQGGNCSGTKSGETISRKGVKIIGTSDLPCTVANHSSALYSRNLLSLLQPIIENGEIILNTEDELIDGSLISKDGDIRKHEILGPGAIE